MPDNILSAFEGWGVIAESSEFLLSAILMTILITLSSLAIAAPLGVIIGTARAYGPLWLDRLLGFVVDSLRSIPLLAILVWMFLAFPIVTGIPLTPFMTASIGLGIHLAAYVSEVIRGGLRSISRGQMRAALALGMTFLQALRVVILPQATIRMLPAIGSLITGGIKDTATASVVAVPELMRQSQILSAQVFRPFEIFTVVAAVYFLLCFPFARLVDALYVRIAHRGAS